MARFVPLTSLMDHAPRRDAIGRLRCKCGWPGSDVAPSSEAFGAHVEDALLAEMRARGLEPTTAETDGAV